MQFENHKNGRINTPQEFPHKLELKDFAELFGTEPSDIPKECIELINKYDFRYRHLIDEERDKLLVNIFKRLDADDFTRAGKEGKTRWDKGWQENLDAFLSAGDVNALVPKYIRPNQPVRLNKNYVMPADSNFEQNWYTIYRQWLFQKFLNPFSTLYEFGCGSGFNIAVLAKLFPNKKLFGTDWAAPSKEIVNTFKTKFNWNCTGHIFDFFNPDPNFNIEKGSGVFTIGALEQTGENYEAFLHYLLEAKPQFVMHIEPICELYEENTNVADYAGYRFHQARRYWRGFPNKLQQLQSEGKIEILRYRRVPFGSLWVEGYNQLIWRSTGAP